jgi:hypothetical protein
VHSRRDCGKIAFEIPSMLPLLSSPFYTFFLLSILPLKAYPIGNICIAQMFTSDHMSTSAGCLALPRSDMTRAIILGSTPDAFGPLAWFELAASGGVRTSRLQRPSIRAGLGARHPMLYASFDVSWKAQRRRPPLDDGLLRRPGIFPGRLHQHQGRGVTLHQKSA